MGEHKSVYLWSLQEAQKLNEVDLWRESYKENCTCARAIEQCIDENYADNRLNTDAAKGIIDRFGFNRVNWVLANTIQRKDFDGRISHANKESLLCSYFFHKFNFKSSYSLATSECSMR